MWRNLLSAVILLVAIVYGLVWLRRRRLTVHHLELEVSR